MLTTCVYYSYILYICAISIAKTEFYLLDFKNKAAPHRFLRLAAYLFCVANIAHMVSTGYLRGRFYRHLRQSMQYLLFS